MNRRANTTFIMLPRPNGAGEVGVRLELITTYAPSTDHDAATHTDIWCGHKITVALPFDAIARILDDAAS